MKSSKLLIILSTLIVISCGVVPISGRKQLLIVPDETVLSSSLSQYKDYISKAPLSNNLKRRLMVNRVGRRIASATEAYLRANGMTSELANFQWEFNLVHDNQLNAFCMPGGKIVVYEGLFNIVRSDDELAVVLGHEVAHAVAKHSNERMSQMILAQVGAVALNYTLQQKNEMTRALANQVYGLGAKFGVMLPFSRKHELEADSLGLILMRLAGYNPNMAIAFWQKMSAAGSGSPIEFMSTHPSNENRIRQIKKSLPRVLNKYRPI